MVDGLNSPEYRRQLARRGELRQAMMTAIASQRLDAILYPHQRRLVVPIGEPQVERNGVLSNSTGFPAISFPGGFSTPTASAPLGVPIGLEILGPEWSEPTLLKLAYAFETGRAIAQAAGEHAGLAMTPRRLSFSLFLLPFPFVFAGIIASALNDSR